MDGWIHERMHEQMHEPMYVYVCTHHLRYSADQFNEMAPPVKDLTYLVVCRHAHEHARTLRHIHDIVLTFLERSLSNLNPHSFILASRTR